MKIVVENISDGEIVPYPVLLIKGRIENLDLDSLKENCCSSPKQKNGSSRLGSRKFFLTHKTENNSAPHVKTIPTFGGKFKILVQLQRGSNAFEFEFCRIFKQFSIVFDPPSVEWHPHRVGLVYIVCANTDGTFQAPKGTKNDIESACKRISVAGALIQSFLGDSLEAHGLSSIPGRKSIQFEDISGDHSSLNFGDLPPVYVHRSKLTLLESHRMSPDELWAFHAKELVAKNFGDRIKFLAMTNATRYSNPTGRDPVDHEAVLALTKGHVALGGGGLGLFGSGCLHTWPETLEAVQERFLDSTLIDRKRFMDDSAYRGTVGGCFATTFGGLIHELGHMLDLGHTENGIMSRGCDDVDKFFTVATASTASTEVQTNASKRRQLLANCSRHAVSLAKTAITSPATTAISRPRMQREGSSYLEEYQRKKYYRKMVQDCGGAFWNRSSAIILNCHRWLNPSDLSETSGDILYDSGKKTIESEFDLVILEFRDSLGSSLKFFEPDAETRLIDLLSLCRQERIEPRADVEIVAANSNGSILKSKF